MASSDRRGTRQKIRTVASRHVVRWLVVALGGGLLAATSCNDDAVDGEGPLCGNGLIDDGEECDGALLLASCNPAAQCNSLCQCTYEGGGPVDAGPDTTSNPDGSGATGGTGGTGGSGGSGGTSTTGGSGGSSASGGDAGSGGEGGASSECTMLTVSDCVQGIAGIWECSSAPNLEGSEPDQLTVLAAASFTTGTETLTLPGSALDCGGPANCVHILLDAGGAETNYISASGQITLISEAPTEGSAGDIRLIEVDIAQDYTVTDAQGGCIEIESITLPPPP